MSEIRSWQGFPVPKQISGEFLTSLDADPVRHDLASKAMDLRDVFDFNDQGNADLSLNEKEFGIRSFESLDMDGDRNVTRLELTHALIEAEPARREAVLADLAAFERARAQVEPKGPFSVLRRMYQDATKTGPAWDALAKLRESVDGLKTPSSSS